jgi:hypothetical protein
MTTLGYKKRVMKAHGGKNIFMDGSIGKNKSYASKTAFLFNYLLLNTSRFSLLITRTSTPWIYEDENYNKTIF